MAFGGNVFVRQIANGFVASIQDPFGRAGSGDERYFATEGDLRSGAGDILVEALSKAKNAEAEIASQASLGMANAARQRIG